MNRFTFTAFSVCLFLAVWVGTPCVNAQAPANPPSKRYTQEEADKLFQEGKWDEALVAYRSVRENAFIAQRAGVAMYYEGWCLFNLKRYAEAAEVFLQVASRYERLTLAPDAMLKAADCHIQAQNLDKAIEVFRQFRKQFPNHPSVPRAGLGEAWCLQQQKKFAEARQLIQAILRAVREPEVRLDAMFLWAQGLMDEKDYAGARKVFDVIAQERDNPRVTEALYQAGESMLAAKELEIAIAYFKRVAPRSVLLRNLDAQLGQLTQQVNDPRNFGIRSFIQARIRTTLNLRRQFEAQNDLRPVSLIRIAHAYQQLQKWDEACVMYEQFLRLYPKESLPDEMKELNIQAHYGYGQMLSQRGRAEQARAQFELFKSLYPDHPLARGAALHIGDRLLAEGRFAEALEMFKQTQGQSKEPAEVEMASYQVGVALVGLQRWDEGLTAYQDFMQKYPSSELIPRVLYQLGRIHVEMAAKAHQAEQSDKYYFHIEQATRHFETIRAQYTERAGDMMRDVLFQLGYFYTWLAVRDKTVAEKALAAFRDFLPRAPNDRRVPEAQYQLARSHYQLGQWEPAVAAYRVILDQYPETDWAPLAAWEIVAPMAELRQTAEMYAALQHYATRYPEAANLGDAMWLVGSHFESEARALQSQRKNDAAQAKLDEALAQYRKLIAHTVSRADRATDKLINPTIAALMRLSAAWEQRKMIDAALSECQSFLETFHASPLVIRAVMPEITRLLARAGKFDEAHSRLIALAGRYPDNPVMRAAVISGRVELALIQHNPALALETANQLSALPEYNEMPAPTHLLVGSALVENSQFTQAQGHLEKALSLADPQDVTLGCMIAVRLGQVWFGLNQPDKAIESFTRVVAQCGDNAALRPEADLGLARALDAKNDVEAARALYRKLIGGRGRVAAEAAFHAGQLHYRLNDHKNALVYYLRAIALTTGDMNETATFRAAQCHDALKSSAAACDAYRLYLNRYPNGKFAAEAQARVAVECRDPAGK